MKSIHHEIILFTGLCNRNRTKIHILITSSRLCLNDAMSLILHLHIAGIATQTILTIPVNHVTSGQMVNLALSNGQVVTTTLANLQTLAQPHHLLAPASAAAAAAAVAASTGNRLVTVMFDMIID
jgi:hypothetical protein